jgi:hypothetical protein
VHNLRPGSSHYRIGMSGKVVHSIRTFFDHFFNELVIKLLNI